MSNSSSASSNFCVPRISEGDVRKALKRLKPSFSCGPDGIPPAILKTYGELLIPILTAIFNNSIQSATFPAAWKLARLVPVFKTGAKDSARNYRPISLLCAASKLFETVLHDVLTSSVKGILISEQHGFMSGRSTTTNLVSFMQRASEAVHHRRQLDTVYFDLSKAFDVVSHPLLISKLSLLNIDNSILDLLISYLRGRTCYVNVNGQQSYRYCVSSGVPQGSVLGPLLFSLFVNDVSAAIRHSSFLLYADDIKIFREVSSLSDCGHLQRDVDAFTLWCKENELIVNAAKTKVLSYTRKTDCLLYHYSVHDVTLPRISTTTDLGVLFDNQLTFTPHVRFIKQRALRRLGMVCRMSKEFRSAKSFLKLYSTVCRPVLEYASVVWNGTCKSNSRAIDKVQNKLLSILRHRFPHEYHRLDSGPRYLQVLPELKARRDTADLLFLFKLIHGQISSVELLSELQLTVPIKTTRKCHPFRTLSSCNRHCPLFRLQSTCNFYSADVDIFNSSLNQFSSDTSRILIR